MITSYCYYLQCFFVSGLLVFSILQVVRTEEAFQFERMWSKLKQRWYLQIILIVHGFRIFINNTLATWRKVFILLVSSTLLFICQPISASSQLCLQSADIDSVNFDTNFGFPNSGSATPGRVLTGYPDLVGSYTTRVVNLSQDLKAVIDHVTISANIEELGRQQLALQEGVIIDYRANFTVQIDNVFDPSIYFRRVVSGPIDFMVIWELLTTGAVPGWQGWIFSQNLNQLTGQSCFGHPDANDEVCDNLRVESFSGLQLCHNAIIEETVVFPMSPSTLELILPYSRSFASIVKPLKNRGMSVGADQSPVTGGKINIQLKAVNVSPLPGDPEVREANIVLYPQNGPILPKREGESTAAFLERIKLSTNAGDSSLRRLVYADDGLAEFTDLERLRRNSFGPGIPAQFSPVYYSVVVTGARTLEANLETSDDKGDTVETIFLPELAINIEPSFISPTLIELELKPADGISSKRDMTELLALQAPNNFAPVETAMSGVTDHLDTLETGTLTDVVLEGVRRAYWAELAVRDAHQYADPLIETSLSSLGKLANEALKRIFSGLKGTPATKADRRLQRQVQDNDKSPDLELDGWDGVNGTNYGDVTDKLKAAEGVSPGDDINETLSVIKLLVKSGFIKIKQLLTDAGKDGPNVDIFLDGLEKAVGAMLEEIVKEGSTSLQTFLPFIVSNAINTQKGTLLDGQVTFSAAALLAGAPPAEPSDEGALRYSLDQMKAWSSADEEIYRTARTNAIGNIINLNNQATATLQNIAYAEFALLATELISTSADVLSTITPHAKVVKGIAEVAKNLGNFALFALPLFTSYDLIIQAENAAYAAFGELPPNTLATTVVTATLSQSVNSSLINTLSNQIVELDAALGALDAALLADNPVLALDALALPSSGLTSTANSYRREARVMLGQAGAGEYPVVSVGEQFNELLKFNSRIALRIGEIQGLSRRLLTEVFARRFNGPDDPFYGLRKTSLRKRIAEAKAMLADFNIDLEDFVFDSTTATYTPFVLISDVSIESKSTGLASISANGEILTITATVTNASSEAISNVDIMLSASVEGVSVNMLSAAVQSAGELGVNDGNFGVGNDQNEVSWTLKYLGDFAAGTMIPLTFKVLEDGAMPINFMSDEQFYLVPLNHDMADADADGMSLYFEIAHGLNIGSDDADEDKDGDGLSNFTEQRLGTSASLADTDGDGLDDGEEVEIGLDGIRTDPLDSDTDNDGALDGVDSAPLDPLLLTQQIATAFNVPQLTTDEPTISLSTNSIVLNGQDFSAFSDFAAHIEVSNSGSGELSWYVEPLIPDMLFISPFPGEINHGPGEIVIALKGTWSPELAIAGAVRVLNASSATPDEQVISVKLGGGALQEYTLNVAVEGQGVIESSDGFIDCGDNCSQNYSMGSIINIMPVPNMGWQFVGWEGSPECGSQFIVSGNMDCIAIFEFSEGEAPVECGGDVVLLPETNFPAGLPVVCVANISLSTTEGELVDIQFGAFVTFESPNIILRAPFRVANGSTFVARRP